MEKKKCTKCGEEKALNEFAYKNKKENIKKYCCKSCDKEVRREYYIQNKERIIEGVLLVNKNIQQRNGRFIWNYLLKHPCVDCGEDNPIVLEFDHKDNVEKLKEISRMKGQGFSIEKLEKEISKCDVRCSNCHKIRTAIQQGWYGYI